MCIKLYTKGYNSNIMEVDNMVGSNPSKLHVKGEKMRIKEWFLSKNFNDNERYVISVSDITIEKESEKAVYIKFESNFGIIKRWIPKSCIMTDEEVKEELRIKTERFNNYQNRYSSLIELGKSNGVKGLRKGLKIATIIEKIRFTGIEIPQELL